ncbi:sulfotransferase [Rhizobium sp.]
MQIELDHERREDVATTSLPDFMCIGAQKSATSWLNKVLLEHPDIFMPPVNELHYFDRCRGDLPTRPRQIHLAKRAIKQERKKEGERDKTFIRYLRHLNSFPVVNEEWYRAAYSWPGADGVKKGDITPSYMEVSDETVEYARKLLGPIKIIMIVRHPADRLLSQLRMWADTRKNGETPTEEKWLRSLARIDRVSRRGSYSIGIPRWQAHFGAGNMLIIPFSDVRKDPLGTIARVEDHIGVPNFDNYTLLDKKIHATRKHEIPASVRQVAEQMTQDEDAYLRRQFGEAFYEKTR